MLPETSREKQLGILRRMLMIRRSRRFRFNVSAGRQYFRRYAGRGLLAGRHQKSCRAAKIASLHTQQFRSGAEKLVNHFEYALIAILDATRVIPSTPQAIPGSHDRSS